MGINASPARFVTDRWEAGRAEDLSALEGLVYRSNLLGVDRQ